MQYSMIALFAAVTGVTMASPMSLHSIRSCDTTQCAIALGPTGATCLGLADPITAGECITEVLVDVDQPPSACAGCGPNVASAVAQAAPAATSAVGSGIGKAANAIGSIF